MGQLIKLFLFFIPIPFTILITAYFTLNAKEICSEPSCHAKRCQLKTFMNENAVPCTNFKKFSCGKHTNSLSPVFHKLDQSLNLFQENIFDMYSNDFIDPLIVKVKVVYDKCSRRERNKNTDMLFRTLLYLTGPFPYMFEESYLKNIKFPIEDYEFGSRNEGLTGQSLFSVYLYQKHKYPKDTAIHIGLPTSTFIDPRVLIKVSHDDKLKERYVNQIKQVLNDYIIDHSMHITGKRISSVLDIELQLATILQNQNNQRTTVLRTNIVKLSKRFPYFSWEYYFKKMYPKANLHTQKIVVTNKKYLYDIEKLFKNKYVLALYMIYRNIMEMRPFLKYSVEFNYFETLYVELGVPSYKDRTQFCKDLIYRYFGPGLTSIIIQQFSIKHSGQNIIKDMIQNIKQSFNESINKSFWMDSMTKTNALRKLAQIKDIVSVSDDELETLSNQFTRQSHYLGFCVHKFMFEIITDLNMYLTKKNKELFDRKQTAFDVLIGPHFHGILYDHNENELIVPIGVLQPTIFDLDWPPYLYYGGIGSEISHVLIKGFNSMIREYSQEKQSTVWWTMYTKDKYDKKHKQCLAYLGLLAVTEESSNNDALVQIEGMALAYRAYLRSKREYYFDDPQLDDFEDYTDKQMFFINYGNSFCSSNPDSSGISSITKPFNTSLDIIHKNKNFKDAFNCKKSSHDSKFYKLCMFW